MSVLYILAFLTIAQGVATLLDGLRAARYLRSYSRPRHSSVGNVAVFCPCKGIDHEFEQNVRSILNQDFADFEVHFILEALTDPAFEILRKAGATRIWIAGEAVDRGQKVHNLQYAVQQVGSTAETYVFCDSDARYPRNWLSEITSPLADDSSRICTGYRWYVPRRFHLPTLLRSAWNSSALGMLGDHARNFAWGGSIAIRRETFERIHVLDSWRGAVSDDYAITRAAEAAGLRIHFIPTCLIPSYGECRTGELLEFTTRQIIITRVYHRRLWQLGLAAQTVFNLTFWGLFVAVLWTGSALPLLLWATILMLSAVRAAIRHFAVRAVLKDRSLSRFAGFYILCSPVVALLYQYNLLRAAFTTDIEWRQIQYKLISPNETRVRRSSAKMG